MDEHRASFEDVFRVEYPGLVRLLAPIVGSTQDAEGIAQDAFVKAFGRWRRIGRYDRPGAWVRRVAIRDAVRAAERARRRPPKPAPEVDRTAAVDTRLDLLRALHALSPRQRACVVLHHLADQPVAEVAESLGCAEATVRVHLHRARTELATLLAPETQEQPDGRR